MTSDSLLIDRSADRLTLTLNRPDAGNTLDLDLAHALLAAISDRETASARVVVIRAEGKVFCGGGDVKAMAAATDASTYLSELTGVFHTFLLALQALNAPVIAAVNGAAAGAGLGLCLAADVVVATERSRFLSAFSSVGLSPDSGVSYHLPRVVGRQRALDLTLTGRTLNARDAQEWGIVARVVADGSLDSAVDAIADQLTAVPGDALAQTKRLITATSSDYASHLADESRTMASVVRHPNVMSVIADFTRRTADKKEDKS